MPTVPKLNPIRDRRYLNWLRTQPCIFTGASPAEERTVDPAHIGTMGRGIKSSDDEALPILSSLHRRMHQQGEMTVIRQVIPDWLLRECLRAFCHAEYKRFLESHPTNP